MNIEEYILRQSVGNIYWKDLNGRYLGCNEQLAKIYGLKNVADIIGKTDFDVMREHLSEDKIKEIMINDQQVMHSGETLITEEMGFDEHGHLAFYLTKKMPLIEKGKIVGLIGTSLDVTQQKHAELMIKQFMENMQHDIRTPFSGIHGIAQILYEQEKDQKKKELLHDIMYSSKELLEYCNGILEFSKIEMGETPLISKKFDLKNLIKKVTAIEKPAASSKSLEFHTYFLNYIPAFLIGDPYRLERILINLLSNAIKFTYEGYIGLIIEFLRMEEDNIYIRFIVKDTGIGIAEEKQKLIFEKFMRLNRANKGIYKGLGLGLKIVKQFIEEMNGEFELQSETDKGTIFSFTLPFKIPPIGGE